MSERHPTNLGYYRLDQQHVASRSEGAAIDPSGLVGNWTNADHETRCLRGVQLEARSGALSIRLDPACGEPAEFPWCAATGYIESSGATAFSAFTACCTRGGVDVRLEGNLNAGLLVLCCYKTRGDAKRPGCFSREYFSKRCEPGLAAGDDNRAAVEDPLFHGIEMPDVLTPETIVGHWRNADGHAKGLRDLWIIPCDEGVLVTAAAHGDIEWGEATGRLCTDIVYGNVGGVAGYARFDFDFVESSMQIREVKGVLVVASFSRFEDREKHHPTFVREFFYRYEP